MKDKVDVKGVQDMLVVIMGYLSRPRVDGRNAKAKQVVSDYMAEYKVFQELAPKRKPLFVRFWGRWA